MRITITTTFAVVLATLVGCAGVNIRRDIYDENGRRLGTVQARSDSLSGDGAVRMLESARLLEENRLENLRQIEKIRHNGDAEKRTADIAKMSVKKGQPTTATTRGGSVTSGYTGYGYGYGGQGDYYGQGAYGPYGQYGQYVQGFARDSGYLPKLGTPIVTGAPFVPGADAFGGGGIVKCPTDRDPTTVAEQAACNWQDINTLLRERGVK